MSRRAEVKARKREAFKALLRRRRRIPRENVYQLNCFSITCEDCGRVWISAIRPIKPNARRGRRRIYICSKCVTDGDGPSG